MEENASPKEELVNIEGEPSIQARKRKMVITAIGAGLASVAVVALLVWYFTRSGDAGR